MLDRFQRITVEVAREHRGRISIALDNDEGTQVSTAFPDERISIKFHLEQEQKISSLEQNGKQSNFLKTLRSQKK